MRTKHYQNTSQEDILTAPPLRLIQLLYRGALDSIASARRHLKLGDIRARSRAISKAMSILTELSLSLDHNAGGDLSKHLAELYAYAEMLLIKANREQSDRPLEEAERLLSTLSEAWMSCTATEQGNEEDAGAACTPQPISCAF